MNFLRLLLVTSFLTLSGCTSLTALFFYPQKVWIATPENAGLEYQDVWLKAADGTQLHSWWLPAQAENPADNHEIMVLYLHGNAENISSHSFSIYWLAKQGINVLALDYRGFGASEGQAVLPSVLQDVEAGARWLREQYPHKKLVVLAQSIGTSLAIPLVAKGQEQYQISGLVLDAPFMGYGRVARSVLRKNLLGWVIWPFTVLVPSQWDARHFAADIRVPTLVMHSQEDRVVPYKQGRQIYERMAATNPKTQWLESQGAHIRSFAYPELRETTLSFILSLP